MPGGTAPQPSTPLTAHVAYLGERRSAQLHVPLQPPPYQALAELAGSLYADPAFASHCVLLAGLDSLPPPPPWGDPASAVAARALTDDNTLRRTWAAVGPPLHARCTAAGDG
jgi:hypothetical protein